MCKKVQHRPKFFREPVDGFSRKSSGGVAAE
jgi:hypothetical protein